jgi:hypothetical protein
MGTTYAVPQGAFTQAAVDDLLVGNYILHARSTDTGINGSNPGRRLITYDGGVLAITLTAPVAGADDGKLIEVISSTAHAHTVTCTGHLQDGAGHSNTATFAAHPAAGFILEAFNGNWMVRSSNGITFS